MTLAREVVLHVAELASLSLDDAEVDALTSELDRIVSYVEQLGEVDTEGVPLAVHTGAAAAAGGGRPDVPGASLPRDEALAQAPATDDGAFVVPRFVDESAGAPRPKSAAS